MSPENENENQNKMRELSKEEMQLDIEARRLNVEELKLRVQDTKESLAERRMKREAIERVQKDRAKTLEDAEDQQRIRVLSCPHKKGGTDYVGFRQGDSPKHSVLKHQLPNADFMVSCTRCGDVVIPPVQPRREEFKGPGSSEEYQVARKRFIAGMAIYRRFLGMPTDNIESTSGLLTDPNDFHRKYRILLHESLGIPLYDAHKYQDNAEEAAA